MTEPMTADHTALIRELIGETQPATDSLIKSLAVSFRNRIDHEHPKHEDFFCLNQVAWSGERMAYVLRRLLDAEAEVTGLRAELAQARGATPLALDRSDLAELALILIEERYRLDKGDDKPVPQPRWGANVRISLAVNAALDAASAQELS